MSTAEKIVSTGNVAELPEEGDTAAEHGFRQRRDSTRSEVIVLQLTPVGNRARSATTTAPSSGAGRRPWLPEVELLGAAHSESLCELNSFVSLRQKQPEDEINDSSPEKDDKSLMARVRRWRVEAEPRMSWLLLIFAIIPVNILVGMEYLALGFFYVEFVEYFDVPSSTVGFIFTVRAAFISILSMFTSTLMKHYSARMLCVCGGIFYFISEVLNSVAPNVYVLYITNGIISGIGNNLAFMTTNVLIQKHFTTNRGFGGSCSTLGYSIGHLIGPILVTFLIQKYGWRGAILTTGAIYAHIIVFGSMYRPPPRPKLNVDDKSRANGRECRVEKQDNTRQRIHNEEKSTEEGMQGDKLLAGIKLSMVEQSQSQKDEDGGNHCLLNTEDSETSLEDNKQNMNKEDRDNDSRQPVGKRLRDTIKTFLVDVFDFSLFRDYRFVLFCLCSMICRYNLSVFLHHMPRKAVTLGISKEDTAYLMSVFSISVVCFRILISFVANMKCVNRMALYGSGIVIGGIGSYLTVIHSVTGISVVSVIHGMHMAMSTTIAFVVIVDLVGISRLPKAMALYTLTVAFGAMSAAPVSGHIYDVTLNYDTPFILSGTLAVVAGLTLVVLVLITAKKSSKTYR